jgi:hypothetical protein
MRRGRPHNTATRTLERYTNDTAGPEACWPWSGYKKGPPPNDYGLVMVGGKRIRAHVLAYLTRKGAIPEGQIVRHKCHHPPCVNPAHLLVGSKQDNSDDMTKALRSSKTYDWKTVQAIRDAYERGVNKQQIANHFGVSWTLVDLYIRRIIRKCA